jgi:predicted ATPase
MVAVIDHRSRRYPAARWRPLRVARLVGGDRRTDPAQHHALAAGWIAEFDGRERAALDAACVAGPSSTSQIVAAVMDCTLEDAERVCAGLVDRRFLIDCGPVEWRDGSIGEAYQFRHMIYRQVVEGSLTGGHRQALHLRVGERLERGYGDRAGEVAGAMAVHFHAGGDYERAFKYSKLASRRAMDRSAYQESIDHMRAAHAALLRRRRDATATSCGY